jgi:hypothetical protein
VRLEPALGCGEGCGLAGDAADERHLAGVDPVEDVDPVGEVGERHRAEDVDRGVGLAGLVVADDLGGERRAGGGDLGALVGDRDPRHTDDVHELVQVGARGAAPL